MVKELNYETALTIIESWEVLRRKKNYAEKMGRGLFVKFFKQQPDASSVFGFDNNDENIHKTPKFIDFANHFVEVIDQAVQMLGPDLELLTDFFVDLGDKHSKEYGIKPKFYPILGRVLMEQLEEMLGHNVFTVHTKVCWLQVYEAFARDMTSTSIIGPEASFFEHHCQRVIVSK